MTCRKSARPVRRRGDRAMATEGTVMRIGHTSLIAVLVLGLFAWSFSADAQQPTRSPQIAILSDEIRLLETSFASFAQGLRARLRRRAKHRLRAPLRRE